MLLQKSKPEASFPPLEKEPYKWFFFIFWCKYLHPTIIHIGFRKIISVISSRLQALKVHFTIIYNSKNYFCINPIGLLSEPLRVSINLAIALSKSSFVILKDEISLPFNEPFSIFSKIPALS